MRRFPTASHPIFEFMAELSDYRPKIWRRFHVSSDISLVRLAYSVMAMFEMEASHLFAVEVFERKNLTRFPEKDYPKAEVSKVLSRNPVEEVVRYEIIGDDYDYPGVIINPFPWRRRRNCHSSKM